MRITQFVVLLLIFCGCSPTGQTQYSTHQDLRTIAAEKLGKDFAGDYNPDKTYIIFKQIRQGDHSQRLIKYIVVKIADHSVVNEGSYQMGYVKWLNNTDIEVMSSEDPARDDQVSKKIISVKSNQQ